MQLEQEEQADVKQGAQPLIAQEPSGLDPVTNACAPIIALDYLISSKYTWYKCILQCSLQLGQSQLWKLAAVDGQQEGLEGLVRTLSRTLSGSLSLDLDTNSALEGFIYDIDSENEWLKALNSPTCEELEPASGDEATCACILNLV